MNLTAKAAQGSGFLPEQAPKPQDNLKAVLEALLFVSDKPLTLEQIRAVLDDLDISQIKTGIVELAAEYEQLNRGIRIVEVAGGFQLRTYAALSVFVKKLFRNKRSERLSRSALETLAIIAYKQPLARSEIEAIRGVNNDAILRNLRVKNLVRITGRKKVSGRPFVFGTTRQFLEYFGLRSIDELPKIEEFRGLEDKVEDSLKSASAKEKTDNEKSEQSAPEN